MFKTKEEIVETVVGAVPYPEQIKEWNFRDTTPIVEFEWRQTRFRVSLSGHVEEIQGDLLVGSDRAILMRELLKRHWVSKL